MKSAPVLLDLLADVRWENETYFRMKMEHFGVPLTLESSGSGRNTIWALTWNSFEKTNENIKFSGEHEMFPRDLILIRVATA